MAAPTLMEEPQRAPSKNGSSKVRMETRQGSLPSGALNGKVMAATSALDKTSLLMEKDFRVFDGSGRDSDSRVRFPLTQDETPLTFPKHFCSASPSPSDIGLTGAQIHPHPRPIPAPPPSFFGFSRAGASPAQRQPLKRLR